MMATTDGSGNPHFYFAYDGFNKSSPHEARGEGYVVDEVLTFTNSDGGTAELVVNSINPTGISLRTNYSGDSDDMNNPPTIGAMKTANGMLLVLLEMELPPNGQQLLMNQKKLSKFNRQWRF